MTKRRPKTTASWSRATTAPTFASQLAPRRWVSFVVAILPAEWNEPRMLSLPLPRGRRRLIITSAMELCLSPPEWLGGLKGCIRKTYRRNTHRYKDDQNWLDSFRSSSISFTARQNWKSLIAVWFEGFFLFKSCSHMRGTGLRCQTAGHWEIPWKC